MWPHNLSRSKCRLWQIFRTCTLIKVCFLIDVRPLTAVSRGFSQAVENIFKILLWTNSEVPLKHQSKSCGFHPIKNTFYMEAYCYTCSAIYPSRCFVAEIVFLPSLHYNRTRGPLFGNLYNIQNEISFWKSR